MAENPTAWGRVGGDGTVERGLPSSGYLRDGSSVSNYSKMPESTIRDEGWLPIEEREDEGPEVEIMRDKIILRPPSSPSPEEVASEQSMDIVTLRVNPDSIARARTLQELKNALLEYDPPDHTFNS